MDWSLLAGGVSRGINDSLQGANTGLLQSEQIRQGREHTALQQQHMNLARDQMQQMMQYRGLANQIAQQRVGIEAQRAQALADYQRGMLGYHAGQLDQQGERNRLFDRRTDVLGGHYQQLGENYKSQDALRQARIKALQDAERLGLPGMGKSSGTETERYKHAAAMRLGYPGGYYDPEMPDSVRSAIDRQFTTSKPFGPERTQRFGDLHTHTGLMDEDLKNKIANPPQSGAEKITLDLARSKLHAYQAAMFRISRAKDMGQPPDPQDLSFVQQVNPQQILQDIVNLQNRVAERGARQSGAEIVEPPGKPAAAAPPAGADAVRQKWGLR